MPDIPELGFLTHSASLPWLLGAAVLLSLGAILVLAGLTALFGLHPLRFVSRTLLGLLLISLGLLEGTITVGIQGYRALAREELAARTLHPLGREKPVDLFDLRKRYAFLAPFLDAEYGSAAFVPVNEPAELELRVSTTGLLIRPAAASKTVEKWLN